MAGPIDCGMGERYQSCLHGIERNALPVLLALRRSTGTPVSVGPIRMVARDFCPNKDGSVGAQEANTHPHRVLRVQPVVRLNRSRPMRRSSDRFSSSARPGNPSIAAMKTVTPRDPTSVSISACR